MDVHDYAFRLGNEFPLATATSYAWAHKILNVYPDDLKEAMRRWAVGEELQNVERSGVSLFMLTRTFLCSVPEAIAVLNDIDESPEIAGTILSNCTGRM